MIWLGMILFFGLHLVPARPALRDQLVGRLGENGYKGAFALLSLAGLTLIIIGYASMEYQEFWLSEVWAKHLTLTIMPIAFILQVAANQKGHIRRKLKHPMLIGVLLWALVHLLNNGDLASILLFGPFALYSVFAILSANRRGKVPTYETANATHDLIAVIVGLVLFGIVWWAHGFLFGVQPVFFG